MCCCFLQNPTQVGVSLQVFYNLDQLAPSLHSVLSGFREALQHESQSALDPATLTQGLDGMHLLNVCNGRGNFRSQVSFEFLKV